MKLDDVIERFAQMLGAQVGCGYLHPTAPSLELKELTENYIARHPYLHQDDGYIDFLRRYAGATLGRPDMAWYVTVYGFYFDWLPFRAFENRDDLWPDEEGFFIFCATFIERPEFSHVGGANYAFDSTGNRKPGVYQRVSWGTRDYTKWTFEWYCGSFVEWFNDLVEKEGILF